MTPTQLKSKINRTQASIELLNQRVDWIIKKIAYRRRRLHELGKSRADALTMKLPLQ